MEVHSVVQREQHACLVPVAEVGPVGGGNLIVRIIILKNIYMAKPVLRR